MKANHPFAFVIALFLFTSLACETLLWSAEIPAATEPLPTDKPLSTVEPSATKAVKTDTPTPISPYFTEDFDSDPQWELTVTKDETNAKRVDSDPDSVTIDFSDSYIIFNIPESSLSAFYLYKKETYDDVRLDMEVENWGVNSQLVSLVCRSGSDNKSYELEVGSDGRWIFKVNQRMVSNGASTAIKVGKETNQYTMICVGNEISFFFNGVEPKGSPYLDYRTTLPDGNVGLVVTSKKAVPVNVGINWFKISKP